MGRNGKKFNMEDVWMETGRPRKYTKELIEEIRVKLDEYIDNNDIPILAEFAYQNNIKRARLYELRNEDEDFSCTMEKIKAKKEAQLEKLGLMNVINSTVSIFSLKQLGWSDKQQIDVSGNVGVTIINDMNDDE
jgi:hypothetical protein